MSLLTLFTGHHTSWERAIIISFPGNATRRPLNNLLSLEEFVFDWEFDGLGKTATPEDLRAEKRRELALRRIGWDVQRFEWRELFAPERLGRRMRGLVPVGAAAAARPRRDLWL